ncbi:methylated-DNA--[protein]-cysteine S-methyltransferase [Coralloluteibacterium stylophorae]|uniref:methylated-DNA--[protein]-cysteine S-methyltransferase n=1 Tax=Coralloluteibacterium stylophorae TaxID=1776034 RepID=A0A8J8B063_9GAMM|nr:methylated-DNA--[protein]-cysteine S-methyltransferase [Coralloluteibacterium stylophorae]MBS7456336.1 methylated-DNA--[protein]-cysteine S-methyltransferase [Coralloluteibacterium stylophorae]
MPACPDGTTLATPAGPLSLLADADGVLHAAGFTARPQALLPRPDARWRERGELGAVTRALRAYLEGDVEAVGALAVAQPGGGFVQAARAAMRAIPAGTTLSYRDLAARAGRPTAVRAAGGACAGNRIAVVVPCHRVLRSDGSLGGFLWGLPVKRWLLQHERRHAAARAA